MGPGPSRHPAKSTCRSRSAVPICLAFRVVVMRVPDSLSVLRLRDFRLLFLGHTVSVFGDRMLNLALAFAVLEVGGSAAEVGLVLACRVLPLVGTVLIGGVIADRGSRRAVMVAADLARVASQSAMAVLLIAGGAEVWMLAALAGLTGAATGFFHPASTGLLPQVVPPEQLQPANGLKASAASVSEIAGPLAGGVLVAAAGPGWAIALDATTFAFSAACLSLLRPSGRRTQAEPASFLTDLREGWTAFTARTWVWTFVVYFAIANIFWGAWTALGPVVAERDLGGATAWGTVLAAIGLGALAGGLFSTRIRPRRPLVHVAFMEGLFSIQLAFLAAVSSVPVLAVGAFISGAGMTLGMTVWESTLQRHIPDESLSRVMSYEWFGSLAFYPLGLAIWGPVAAVIGISVSLWVAFALFLASIVTLLAVPDIRRLPAAPEARPARGAVSELQAR
jgi:MFS family permease